VRKCLFFAVIFSVFGSLNASASLVAFHIVETGIPENRQPYQYTGIWEDAFMNVFFDAGYIVSNAPVLRLETKPSDDILNYVLNGNSEIRNFGIDYLLIAQLDYNGDTRQPAEINLVIFRVITNEKIYERKIEGKTYRSTREGQADIETIIRGLVSYIR